MNSQYIDKALSEIEQFQPFDLYTEDRGPLISVNKLTSKAGSMYEKLRYMVDYKEEHTIRRAAIERIVKRVVMVKSDDNADIGKEISEELVRARYLPNEKITESIALEIQTIVKKYVTLERKSGIPHSIALSLAATEIDRLIFPHPIGEAVIRAYNAQVADAVNYDGDVQGEALSLQVYIATRRSLLSEDFEMVLYALVVKMLPSITLRELDAQKEEEIAGKLQEVVRYCQAAANHPLSWKISAKLRNHSIYFRVLSELIGIHKHEVRTVLEKPDLLEEEVLRLLGNEYAIQNQKLQKSGMRAVAYIVLTKMVIAAAIEFPYEKYILGKIDYFALGTNIVFHPLLLFLIVKTTKKPDAQNTELILSGIQRIVSGEAVKPIYVKDNKRGPLMNGVFIVLYALLYSISFGVLLFVLNLLNFNVASIALFLFFLTLVSYFGFRLRYGARKWTISRGNEKVSALIWNFFTFPIVRTGRFLSRKFSTVNVFVLLLDFIIETPFKFMLGTFDSFVQHLKEREEDPL